MTLKNCFLMLFYFIGIKMFKGKRGGSMSRTALRHKLNDFLAHKYNVNSTIKKYSLVLCVLGMMGR